VLLWSALVALLAIAQTLLVLLTLGYESTREGNEVEAAASEAAVSVRRDLLAATRALQGLSWRDDAGDWRAGALALMRGDQALRRIERRDAALRIVDAVDAEGEAAPFAHIGRDALGLEAELACVQAGRSAAPAFSRSYFVPLDDGRGLEMIDLCVPPGGAAGTDFVVGTLALAPLLDAAMTPRQGRRHELSFVDADGSRLARAGPQRGAAVYVAERPIDLPGIVLRLRADSVAGRPSLIPNLSTALVIGLSLALSAVVVLLARDVRRRAAAEKALAEALAFRQAMEESLVTGLRARDLQGRITYVNPAFRSMVGFDVAELSRPVPPYWPPEHVAEYTRRQQALLAGGAARAREAREGFETVFMRKGGERFPVMIYEAPLVDWRGRHTGWMSAVLDIGAQRRAEETARQQQERLQAAARLATLGEMASLLSHELNQPLAAIASYAAGSLNLLDDADLAAPDGDALRSSLRDALGRIGAQAERAGRVIRSVHDVARRREQAREAASARSLLDAVLPLAALQARKSGARIEIDVPEPSPSVLCDRTMVEQVLLNLTRNGLQAMESDTPAERRVLLMRARQTHPRWVTFAVADAGCGIAPEVAQRLFTPFFTTRTEGMGLGLSLCRTVIEQHGGALDFGPGPGGVGTEFRFTLPAAPAPEAPLAMAVSGELRRAAAD
jgi:two-component system sensor histidine kinase DctS